MVIALGYGKRVLGRTGDQREQGKLTWPRESLHTHSLPEQIPSIYGAYPVLYMQSKKPSTASKHDDENPKNHGILASRKKKRKFPHPVAPMSKMASSDTRKKKGHTQQALALFRRKNKQIAQTRGKSLAL